MGCGPSNPENAQALETVPEISLMSVGPRVSGHADIPLMASFGLSEAARSPPSRPPPSTFPTEMIEHATPPAAPAPDAELSRHQRFVERFSLIEANTFQAVPMLSFTNPPGAFGIEPSHNIDEHCRFIDQVLGSLSGPFAHIRVPYHQQLAVALA
jgi:hypothetical protein